MCSASDNLDVKGFLYGKRYYQSRKKSKMLFLSEQLFAEMQWRCSHLGEFIPRHRMLTVHVLYNRILGNKTLPSARLHVIRETAAGLT